MQLRRRRCVQGRGWGSLGDDARRYSNITVWQRTIGALYKRAQILARAGEKRSFGAVDYAIPGFPRWVQRLASYSVLIDQVPTQVGDRGTQSAHGGARATKIYDRYSRDKEK